MKRLLPIFLLVLLSGCDSGLSVNCASEEVLNLMRDAYYKEHPLSKGNLDILFSMITKESEDKSIDSMKCQSKIDFKFNDTTLKNYAKLAKDDPKFAQTLNFIGENQQSTNINYVIKKNMSSKSGGFIVEFSTEWIHGISSLIFDEAIGIASRISNGSSNDESK